MIQAALTKVCDHTAAWLAQGGTDEVAASALVEWRQELDCLSSAVTGLGNDCKDHALTHQEAAALWSGFCQLWVRVGPSLPAQAMPD